MDPSKTAGVHRPLYGVPYVGWSPRPAKNGQPTTCTTCIPARKVGGFARKIPLIWAGPKTKEQILEKWDPVSKRLVKVKCECVAVPIPPVEFYDFIYQPSYDAGTTGTVTYQPALYSNPLIITKTDRRGNQFIPNSSDILYIYSTSDVLLATYEIDSILSVDDGYANPVWYIYTKNPTDPHIDYTTNVRIRLNNPSFPVYRFNLFLDTGAMSVNDQTLTLFINSVFPSPQIDDPIANIVVSQNAIGGVRVPLTVGQTGNVLLQSSGGGQPIRTSYTVFNGLYSLQLPTSQPLPTGWADNNIVTATFY